MSEQFHSVDDYIYLPRSEQTWVVEHILPTSGKLVVFSSPKVGKSFACLQLCGDVAFGRPSWLGFPIHTTGPTMYLQLDTPRNLWVDTYILRLRNLPNNLYPLDGVRFADREDIPSYPFDIRYNKHHDWLKENVEKFKPTLVVVDTYREVFRGQENDSDTAQDVLSSLSSAIYPAAMVIISHRAKESTDKDAVKRELIDSVRGNTYLAGAADALLRVERDGFTYVSRTKEQSQVKLERHHSGIWMVPQK